MSKNTVIGILVAVAILVLAIVWLLIGRQAGQIYPPTSSPAAFVTPTPASPAATTAPTTAATESANKVEVKITSAGFSSKSVEIPASGTVTWVNEDTQTHQIASTPHPVHTDYPPLNSVGTLQPGQTRSLTFPESGTYRYHNHLNPALTGTVVVK